MTFDEYVEQCKKDGTLDLELLKEADRYWLARAAEVEIRRAACVWHQIKVGIFA